MIQAQKVQFTAMGKFTPKCPEDCSRAKYDFESSHTRSEDGTLHTEHTLYCIHSDACLMWQEKIGQMEREAKRKAE